MIIDKLEIFPLSIPLKADLQIASGSMKAGRHVLVRIVTNEGVYGWGEASPISATDGETQASISACLSGPIQAVLKGANPLDLGSLVDRISHSVPMNYCAKVAAEMALHDLSGKILGIPVYQLLGGRRHDEISIKEADLWIDTPGNMAAAAERLAAEGIMNFEVKIGTDPAVDVERIRAVRNALGHSAKLRVDCNEGYAADMALKALRKMEEFDLAYIEQPVVRWNLAAMASITRALDTPICADQSAYTPHDAFRIIVSAAANLICIKVPRTGLLGSRAIAETCQAAGLRCTLGSMLPLGVGTAALHHFAIHAPNIDLQACGLYGSPLDYYVDDVVAKPSVDSDGVIRLEAVAGLGIDVDASKLSRYQS